jgi:hypothetical protein
MVPIPDWWHNLRLMDYEKNYLDYYNSENYLLRVGDSFRQTVKIEPADFYMILVWKANRAKNYHRDRLKDITGSNFETAVSTIALELSSATGKKQRLEVLLEKWKFALPTASAILTILYPDDFTVYDYRVCREVGRTYRNWLGWTEYEQFEESVIDAAPRELKLRDKDRFLIGRSTRKDIERDCTA